MVGGALGRDGREEHVRSNLSHSRRHRYRNCRRERGPPEARAASQGGLTGAAGCRTSSQGHQQQQAVRLGRWTPRSGSGWAPRHLQGVLEG